MSIEGQPVDKISSELGVSESSIYVYKKRVQDRLQEEIAYLNSGIRIN